MEAGGSMEAELDRDNRNRLGRDEDLVRDRSRSGRLGKMGQKGA